MVDFFSALLQAQRSGACTLDHSENGFDLWRYPEPPHQPKGTNTTGVDLDFRHCKQRYPRRSCSNRTKHTASTAGPQQKQTLILNATYGEDDVACTSNESSCDNGGLTVSLGHHQPATSEGAQHLGSPREDGKGSMQCRVRRKANLTLPNGGALETCSKQTDRPSQGARSTIQEWSGSDGESARSSTTLSEDTSRMNDTQGEKRRNISSGLSSTTSKRAFEESSDYSESELSVCYGGRKAGGRAQRPGRGAPRAGVAVTSNETTFAIKSLSPADTPTNRSSNPSVVQAACVEHSSLPHPLPLPPRVLHSPLFEPLPYQICSGRRRGGATAFMSRMKRSAARVCTPRRTVADRPPTLSPRNGSRLSACQKGELAFCRCTGPRSHPQTAAGPLQAIPSDTSTVGLGSQRVSSAVRKRSYSASSDTGAASPTLTLRGADDADGSKTQLKQPIGSTQSRNAVDGIHGAVELCCSGGCSGSSSESKCGNCSNSSSCNGSGAPSGTSSSSGSEASKCPPSSSRPFSLSALVVAFHLRENRRAVAARALSALQRWRLHAQRARDRSIILQLRATGLRILEIAMLSAEDLRATARRNFLAVKKATASDARKSALLDTLRESLTVALEENQRLTSSVASLEKEKKAYAMRATVRRVEEVTRERDQLRERVIALEAAGAAQRAAAARAAAAAVKTRTALREANGHLLAQKTILERDLSVARAEAAATAAALETARRAFAEERLLLERREREAPLMGRTPCTISAGGDEGSAADENDSCFAVSSEPNGALMSETDASGCGVPQNAFISAGSSWKTRDSLNETTGFGGNALLASQNHANIEKSDDTSAPVTALAAEDGNAKLETPRGQNVSSLPGDQVAAVPCAASLLIATPPAAAAGSTPSCADSDAATTSTTPSCESVLRVPKPPTLSEKAPPTPPRQDISAEPNVGSAVSQSRNGSGATAPLWTGPAAVPIPAHAVFCVPRAVTLGAAAESPRFGSGWLATRADGHGT